MAVTADDMSRVWSGAKLAVTVPRTVSINVTGRKIRGVYAKDVSLAIARELGGAVSDEVIEYTGSVVSQMSISERFTLSYSSADVGARAVVCPYDATTRRYLTGRTMANYKPVVPDKNAEYTEIYQISIDQLAPQVGCPGDNNNVKPAAEIEGLTVNQVVIGTCSNGRFDDRRVAADILEGKSVKPECRRYV
jgi:homoaconitase/3-isopropylmalate dehydratase large subunit